MIEAPHFVSFSLLTRDVQSIGMPSQVHLSLKKKQRNLSFELPFMAPCAHKHPDGNHRPYCLVCKRRGHATAKCW